jgi:uncharacterized membrane protein
MTRYDLYLFVHIAAATVWLGAGVMIQILAARAHRMNDDEGLVRVFGDVGALSKIVFIPASATVGALGILMVVDGPWSFEWLWIVLGLAGYIATFVTGLGVMEPGAAKIVEGIERDGGQVTPATVRAIRRLLTIARVDTIVLYLVVFVMVAKPTGDDAGLLIALAAILVAGLGFVFTKVRAIDAEGAGAAPPAEAPAT